MEDLSDYATLNAEASARAREFVALVGEGPVTLTHQQMGRRIVETCMRDGKSSDRKPLVTLSAYLKAAYRRYGRAPFTVVLNTDHGGSVSSIGMDFDKPPVLELRTPALYVQELELRPRDPALVPGWMKVELAAVGAWDLRTDAPTWKDHEPTGMPQTPNSVGIAPPDGAEWALPPEQVRLQPSDHADDRFTATWPAGLSPSPDRVVDPGPFLRLAQRWDVIADTAAGTVARTSLSTTHESQVGEPRLGIAPALRDVAEALGCVRLGPILLDWPSQLKQRWPELGENRRSYQPIWIVGREAIAVRLDASGSAGDVLHVRGDGGINLEAGGVDILAPDLLTWWTRLTAWAEQTVPTLITEITAAVDDAEEVPHILHQAIEQDFTEWLARLGTPG